eukprot:g4108.t1
MGGAAASKPAGGGGVSSGGGAGRGVVGGAADAEELDRLRREVKDLRRQLDQRSTEEFAEKKESWTRAPAISAPGKLAALDEHEIHARGVHDEHERHERMLKARMESQKKASRKSLNSRLAARLRVKQTKALQKVPVFASLADDIISALVDKMEFQKFEPGDVLCGQGDVAEHFYIIVHGECHVIVKKKGVTEIDQFGDNVEVPETEVQVGILNELDFFGEAALFDRISMPVPAGGTSKVQVEKRVRTATVRAGIENRVKTLRLHRDDFDDFVKDGKIDGEAVFKVRKVGMERQRKNSAIGLGPRDKASFSWTPQQELPGNKEDKSTDKQKEVTSNANEVQPKSPSVDDPGNATDTAAKQGDDIHARLEKAERECSHAKAAEVAALQQFYAAKAQIKALEAQVQQLTKPSGGNDTTQGQSIANTNPPKALADKIKPLESISDTNTDSPSAGASVGSKLQETKARQAEARKARLAKLEQLRKQAKTRTHLSSAVMDDQQTRQTKLESHIKNIALC